MAARLLSDDQREEFTRGVAKEYQTIREQRAAERTEERLTPIAEARRNRLVVDWKAVPPPRPTFLGIRQIAPYPLERHGFTHADSWYDEYRRILELFEAHLK